MNTIFALTSILCMCCYTRAFSHSEKVEIFCAINYTYLLRFMNCTIARSSEFYQKASDVLYECFNQYYENRGKLDSIFQFMCYESGKDVRVHRCFIDRTVENLGTPKRRDRRKFDRAIKHCIIYG
ncbi:venom protein 29-like [Centruroides vittatus]|uniref:venom protein 29-like n=1 Tax=Centruroides vittatus TaxID=120091 RepID=UPI00350F4AE8